MLPLNYHHLYYFWTTAKAGAIGAASRQLHLAQPTLSLQLKTLEISLGKRLFERGRRGVTLTADGRIAFDYCERIFSQGNELAAALNPEQGSRPAILRLGVVGPVSRHAVIQILEHIHGVDRGTRISLLGGNIDELRERLERHRLDLIVSTVDVSNQMGLEFRSVLAGTIQILFVARRSIKAKVKKFPEDLARVPMLLMAPENPVRKDVDLFLCRHRVPASIDVELEDAELLRRLALRGDGVAALDALTAREDLTAGRLVLVGRNSRLKQMVWFACGRHPKPNRILHKVIESLMERFKIRS